MDLKQWLDKQDVWYELHERSEGLSAEQGARDLGVSVALFAKSLILLDDQSKPYKVLVPGDKKMSFKKVKEILGVKKLRLCPFDDAINYSGFLPGSTPPVFHVVKMPVVMDSVFEDREFLYGGGGTRTLSVQMKCKDVKRLNEAIVADVCD